MHTKLKERFDRRGGLSRRAAAGFTIVELAIVILVMMILLAIIVPGYRFVVVKGKETVLKQDLQTMRRMIDQYTADKEKAPASLDDLVSARYIPEVPVDPMTNTPDWDVVLEDESISLKGERGIVDVHSQSGETGTDGRRYSDW